MELRELLSVLEDIAPLRLAEHWDNVGLIAGDPAQTVSRAMITVDYTDAVATEVRRERCDVVIAYHPPLFEAVKRLNAGSVVFDAIRRGVAIYSPHTALDAAEGGTNDVLADAIGIEQPRTSLRLSQPKDVQYKLVTFVPEADLDRLSRALFDAGAGRIGNYSACSFRSVGTGTFFGEAGTNPAVGQSGRLEQVVEVRLETLVPIARLEPVLRALRAAHPYEEPAFDLVRLAAPPEGPGIGRVGRTLPVPRKEVFARIKRALEVPHLLVAGPCEGEVRSAAVCAGACGDLVNEAIARRVDLLLTGEMRHHDALKAARAGVTVVCALHSNSERSALARLRDRLAERLPKLDVLLSREDRDPFAIL